MSEQETLKRRLNKINQLLDNHLLKVQIQECYIGFLEKEAEPDRIVDTALEEARRLATYHRKQIKIRSEERQLLALGEQKEAS